MQLYSTTDTSIRVSMREAVLQGMPDTGGLYMPVTLPEMPAEFFTALPDRTLTDIAYDIASEFFGDEIPASALESLVTEAINFPAPIKPIKDNIHTLELFHGHTLAFKDYGARFMARIMGYFTQDLQEDLTILVATSGDTGSAVASGFLGIEGIRVIILYPLNKVSLIQEKQFTTLGQNITALEIDGTFDDCQRLVKSAFTDKTLNEQIRLSSANSINIARLIPQSFYYFHAWGQVRHKTDRPVIISVPSGNYGNLTAGLMAKIMGLPVQKFIAASNANDVVPQYLHTGEFSPRPSVETISNAMDVGDPSNFERILDLYDYDITRIRRDIVGESYGDYVTKAAIRNVYKESGYILDPHGAVGYLALEKHLKGQPDAAGIFFETAHPAKFLETVQPLVDANIVIPDRLQQSLEREKKSIPLSNKFSELKEFLLGRFS